VMVVYVHAGVRFLRVTFVYVPEAVLVVSLVTVVKYAPELVCVVTDE